jgi:HSP20 family molecular chaperone IbpA
MFSRTFHLPVPVDAERIVADLRDGVLTVTCPKSADAAARRIHVS